MVNNPYEVANRSSWKTEQVEKYLPLVKRIAGRLAISLPQHVDEDDLIGYGVFGLLDALEKFDLSKAAKFETYATLRIRGAIIDGLRTMDWVPHSARQKIKKVQDAFGQVEAQLGRPASIEEVAKYLDMDEKEVENTVHHGQILNLTSLD